MRRKVLGSVAVWLAGGAALAADKPGDVFPMSYPPPAALPDGPAGQLIPFNKPAVSAAPAVQQAQALQPMPGAAPTQLPPTVAGTQPLPAPATAPADDWGWGDAPAAALADRPAYQASRFFGSVDYLLMWVRRNPTPPLVQVIPPNLADFEHMQGDLPPGAAVSIFGGHGTDPGAMSGVRLFGGMWLDGGKNWGVDGSYAQLFQQADTFAIASSGVPVIGRGFVDAGVGKESFLRYTTPDGLSTGYIAVDAPVKMYTFDGNIRVRGTTVFMDETDYLAGLRYLNLKDSVTINSAIAIRPAPGATPFVIASNESFRARNQFYGSQIGFDSHSQYKCWTLDVTAKLASGWVHQEVDIAGSASQQFGSAVQVFPNESILYVQPTNVGRYSRDRFAVVPELLLKLGYQITPHIRATVGYDILTVSSVERSGAAINPAVNPEFTRFIVVHKNSGLHEPTFHFSGTDFWAQGITFGLTMTY